MGLYPYCEQYCKSNRKSNFKAAGPPDEHRLAMTEMFFASRPYQPVSLNDVSAG